jgi:hypothetical protein
LPLIATSGSVSYPSKASILGAHVLERSTDVGMACCPARSSRRRTVSGRCSGFGHYPRVQKTSSCDGALFVMPICKVSSSRLMKLFIDLLSKPRLHCKVPMLLALGGSDARVLARDYGLRSMSQSLRAWYVIQGYFVRQSEINEGGAIRTATSSTVLRGSHC